MPSKSKRRPATKIEPDQFRSAPRGEYELVKGWRVKLPVKMAAYYDAKFDDEVLQRQGLTFRYWKDPNGASAAKVLTELLVQFTRAPNYDHRVEEVPWGLRYSFYADEKRQVGPGRWRVVYIFYGYAITHREHLHFQGYADKKSDLKLAVRGWKTLRPSSTPKSPKSKPALLW